MMPSGKNMKGEKHKKNLGGLIGIGADKLLKSSEGARSLTKNLGLAGQLVGKYYDKKADSKDKTTGQVTAKQKGGSVKKAFIGGMFKKSSTATASGGTGDASNISSKDQLNSVLGALMGSKFGKGMKNTSITYSGDTSGQITSGKQTGQVTAKREGGMVCGGRAEIKGTRPAKLS